MKKQLLIIIFLLVLLGLAIYFDPFLDKMMNRDKKDLAIQDQNKDVLTQDNTIQAQTNTADSVTSDTKTQISTKTQTNTKTATQKTATTNQTNAENVFADTDATPPGLPT
jgi:hypothetical protein